MTLTPSSPSPLHHPHPFITLTPSSPSPPHHPHPFITLTTSSPSPLHQPHHLITLTPSSPSPPHHPHPFITLTPSSPSPLHHPHHLTTLTPSSPSPLHHPHPFITLTPSSASTPHHPHPFITLTPSSPSPLHHPHHLITLTPSSPSPPHHPHPFNTLTPSSLPPPHHPHPFITLTTSSPSPPHHPHHLINLTPSSPSPPHHPHPFITLTPSSASTPHHPHPLITLTLTTSSPSPLHHPHPFIILNTGNRLELTFPAANTDANTDAKSFQTRTAAPDDGTSRPRRPGSTAGPAARWLRNAGLGERGRGDVFDDPSLLHSSDLNSVHLNISVAPGDPDAPSQHALLPCPWLVGTAEVTDSSGNRTENGGESSITQGAIPSRDPRLELCSGACPSLPAPPTPRGSRETEAQPHQAKPSSVGGMLLKGPGRSSEPTPGDWNRHTEVRPETNRGLSTMTPGGPSRGPALSAAMRRQPFHGCLLIAAESAGPQMESKHDRDTMRYQARRRLHTRQHRSYESNSNTSSPDLFLFSSSLNTARQLSHDPGALHLHSSLGQWEEASLSLGQWEEASLDQWEEASLDQWEEASLGQWEEASLGQWEEASLGQWEEASLGQWEEASLGQWEEASLSQWEEASPGQWEEASLGQ
ncbi:unnamed protein product [Gadus morhua 'NCC']